MTAPGGSFRGSRLEPDLIVHHLDSDSRRVLLDWRDVRDIGLAELQAHVALVD